MVMDLTIAPRRSDDRHLERSLAGAIGLLTPLSGRPLELCGPVEVRRARRTRMRAVASALALALAAFVLWAG